MRPEVKILKVLRITPGGSHAWVETNVGELRKPLKAIPQRLLDEYNKEKGGDGDVLQCRTEVR